ncbi:hypothetical protein LAZ40_10980 [Cereibacter sphaeroides]|uniref:hypothetical protein n=1 Tax=Cereibacter sphaeroides TaxID=1063 RepID=UPI001F22F2EB|nr:hypothetical protein [Cereibacter sphaeroides]MCE6959579.1 hypothetical protein [Cereibacter sphaeroides]MCE6974561.1 hypothetical protein [Cereibacter sphaeroides]
MLRVPVLFLAFLLSGAVAIPSLASSSRTDGSAVVIRNDRGGPLIERIAFIDRVRREKLEIRITGRICHSACTLLAFLPEACVDPRTRFGFHGPRIKGQRMDPAAFDRWSTLMARYYPPTIRAWFLSRGRYRQGNDFFVLTGTEMVRHGARPCS